MMLFLVCLLVVLISDWEWSNAQSRR